MKSATIIADTMSEWRTVRHAPDLAHELFDLLDADEITRLATAGFAAEIRKALTAKAAGVPQYSSIVVIDPATGKKTKRYKQTGLFTEGDYRVAIDSYVARSDANLSVAKALIAACAAKFGVQLTLTVATGEAAS